MGAQLMISTLPPDGSPDTLLSIEHVSKRYHSLKRDAVSVLEGVSFTLQAGESMALTGPSGSGKSTLTQLIAGTEPLSSGVIYWRGRALPPVSDPNRSAWRLKEVGLVFQDFRLFPHLTALENAALPLELLGRPAAKAEERARALLDKVQLSQRLQHLPSELSGGEQQRVAIARALAHNPSIVIADEPTGNLDWRSARRIADLLFELSAQQGVALFVVTHDLSLAERADKHLRLHQGQLQSAPSLEDQHEQ